MVSTWIILGLDTLGLVGRGLPIELGEPGGVGCNDEQQHSHARRHNKCTHVRHCTRERQRLLHCEDIVGRLYDEYAHGAD